MGIVFYTRDIILLGSTTKKHFSDGAIIDNGDGGFGLWDAGVEGKHLSHSLKLLVKYPP